MACPPYCPAVKALAYEITYLAYMGMYVEAHIVQFPPTPIDRHRPIPRNSPPSALLGAQWVPHERGVLGGMELPGEHTILSIRRLEPPAGLETNQHA